VTYAEAITKARRQAAATGRSATIEYEDADGGQHTLTVPAPTKRMRAWTVYGGNGNDDAEG
jgi:hypothetical protein